MVDVFLNRNNIDYPSHSRARSQKEKSRSYPSCRGVSTPDLLRKHSEIRADVERPPPMKRISITRPTCGKILGNRYEAGTRGDRTLKTTYRCQGLGLRYPTPNTPQHDTHTCIDDAGKCVLPACSAVCAHGDKRAIAVNPAQPRRRIV